LTQAGISIARDYGVNTRHPHYERRRSQCPRCERERGQAIKLKSAGGLRTIHYRCAACGHGWNYTQVERQRSIRG